MAADWFDGFELESIWHRETGRYQLVLHNHGRAPLSGFSLGFSGPARISDAAEIGGGRVVQQLSNYCEIVPDTGFVLPPGGSWSIEIDRLDSPIRHWTDGATAGFVIGADGATTVALTRPTRLAGWDREPWRLLIARGDTRVSRSGEETGI